MIIFYYDKTFEGLLTAVFEAYNRKQYPDKLLLTGELPPLFADDCVEIITDSEKSGRVWKGLEAKIQRNTLNMITHAWLSELENVDSLIFRYIRKTFDTTHSIESNYADPDVFDLMQIARKTGKEKHRLIEFIRFQKAADDMYFAPVSPEHNVLPLIIEHFSDRFHDQKWIIYDMKRNYGYYYDLNSATEITLENTDLFPEGKLNEQMMAEDEKLFQKMWKSYFKALTIQERINPKLHRQHLPKRFWKYLTEKQD